MNKDEIQTLNVAYTPGEGQFGYDKGGIITGIFNVNPEGLGWRLCYQVTYPNGLVDYVRIQEYDLLKGASR